jgi:hypothetical protein
MVASEIWENEIATGTCDCGQWFAAVNLLLRLLNHVMSPLLLFLFDLKIERLWTFILVDLLLNEAHSAFNILNAFINLV